MLRIREGTIIIGVVLLLSASGVLAQEPQLEHQRDAVAVVNRTIDWFLDSRADYFRSRGKGVTFVISHRTREMKVGLERMGSQALNFASADMQRIEQRAGVPVAACDTFSVQSSSLCDIREPWLWLIIASVSIQGDRATVDVEEVTLQRGPGGKIYRSPEGKAWPEGASYKITLRRERGAWKFVSAEPTGTT